jgi:hypothetical protein
MIRLVRCSCSTDPLIGRKLKYSSRSMEVALKGGELGLRVGPSGKFEDGEAGVGLKVPVCGYAWRVAGLTNEGTWELQTGGT